MRLQPTRELESTFSAFAALGASASADPSDAELQQKYYGTDCEIRLAKLMLESLSGMFCYHNFEGEFHDSRFEIDFLILTSAGKVLLVEVKGYKGFYDLCPSDPYLLDKIDRGARSHQVKNPLRQIARAQKLLKAMLNRARTPIWLDSVVVFVGDFWPSKPLLNSFYSQEGTLVTTESGLLSYLQSLTVSPFFPDNPLGRLVDFLFYEQKKAPLFFDPFFFHK